MEENFVGYGLKDFLTDLGGLLGLFLGCSTVSVVELFYHPIRALLRRYGISFQNQVQPAQKDQEESYTNDAEEVDQEQVSWSKQPQGVNIGASTSRPVFEGYSSMNIQAINTGSADFYRRRMQDVLNDSSSSFESLEEIDLKSFLNVSVQRQENYGENKLEEEYSKKFDADLEILFG